MIIKYLGVEDIEEIAELWERMVLELAPNYKSNVSWWVEMAKKLMATDCYSILGAIEEETKRIVGFLDFFIYPEPSTGKLHGVAQHLYVMPKYRDKHISARLYRKAINHGKANAVEVMELFCFDDAKSMWQRKGFKPVRTLMRRSLCTIQ